MPHFSTPFPSPPSIHRIVLYFRSLSPQLSPHISSSSHISFHPTSSISPSSYRCSSFSKSQDEEEEEDDDDEENTYWTTRIHSLCNRECRVEEAMGILHNLTLRGHRPNSIIITSLIHGLCNSNRHAEAHRRLLLFISSGFTPDLRTCNILIALLLRPQTLDSTLLLLRYFFISTPLFVPSPTTYNRLIHLLCTNSRPGEAHRLLFHMVSRGVPPSVVTYTSIIGGYCKIGGLADAHKVFDEMLEQKVGPNSLTYSVLMKGVLRNRDMVYGKKLMGEVFARMESEKMTCVSSAAFSNVMDSLCREGLFEEVYRIAEEMPQVGCVPPGFAYARMVYSLCKAGMFNGASRIVYIQKRRGILPSLVSYNSIIHGLSLNRCCMRAFQLFKQGIEWGYVPSLHTYKVLIQSLCQQHDLVKADELLRFMLTASTNSRIVEEKEKEKSECTRIYNIYLHALCMTGDTTELLNVLFSMIQGGPRHRPDVVTLNTIVHGFCLSGRVERAKKMVHDMTRGALCPPDHTTFTSLISGLLRCGRTREGIGLFLWEMPRRGLSPGLATHNAVIRGLFCHCHADMAMVVLRRMAFEGVAADCTTHALVVGGLCACRMVDEAKTYWEGVVWPSGVHDEVVYGAMLKGLCEAGEVDEAIELLYELRDCGARTNVVCYNVVIGEACRRGMKREAYGVVSEMKSEGLRPDAVTWRTLDKLHP